MKKSLTRYSKFLSLVLRHDPGAIGLELDESGWVSISSLLAAAKQSGREMDRQLLLQIVEENDKQRFSISEDGLKIRANQGHSIEIDLNLEPKAPPETLYHGTVEKFIQSIKAKGLISGGRQHVHLSEDRDTANRVGRRRGQPIVLVVQASQMVKDQFVFFQSKNGVWLTDHVPPRFINFP